MAVNSEKNYYINPKALSFTPNYQGYRNIVYVSIVSNAAIKAYHNDIDGLGYGMDAEYQTWRLSGTTTALGTASAYFIYARLSRTQHVADIIFSVRDYNVEGGYSYTDSEGNAQTVEKSDEYFYIKIGSLTATDAAGDDATVNRVLTYVSGELGTDKQINEKSDSVFEQMFEFVSSGVEKLINVKQPFKSITVAGESLFKGLVTFVKGFVLGDREINAIATSEDNYNEDTKDSTLPTTGYVQKEIAALDDHFLIKDDPDAEQSVAGPVTFEQDVTVQGDHAVGKSQTIGGNQTINGTQEVKGIQTLHQGFKTPDFNDAAGQITGAQLTASGILTVSGLKAMSFEVFEFIYNVIRSRGGKEVISNAATIESCQYKLTDGTLITPDEFYAQGSSYTLESIKSVYLTIKKDEQNKGAIPFRNSDILYGYVNQMGESGQYAVGGECIMSIIQSDDTIGVDGSMTIEAKLFEVNTTIQPSEEGYYDYVSSNMAPTNGMAVAQRGNNRGTEGRTTSFFLDSETSNIIILQNVTTPRLSTGNYGVINGLLPSDIYDKVYSKYSFLSKYDPVVYARYGIFENILQFDHQGNIIRRENNRGAWSAAIAGSSNLNERYKSEELTYDVVTYDGQLWKCVQSNVTSAPDQGEGWLLLVAKGADGTSIKVNGSIGSVDELPKGDKVKDGDGYIVGLDLYIWSEESGEWINAGQFKGENGKTQYLHIAYANKDAQGKIIDFSTTDPTGREYIGTCSDFNIDDPAITEDNDPYTWKYNKGDKGYTGEKGDKGDSVTGSTIQYAVNQSMTTKPNENQFSPAYPTTINEGDVLWTRTRVNFDNATIKTEWAYSASRQGKNGLDNSSVTFELQPNVTTIYIHDEDNLSTESINLTVRKTTSKGVEIIDNNADLLADGFKLQYTYDGILDDRKDIILNPETILLEDGSEMLLEDDSAAELEFTVEDILNVKNYIEFYLVKTDNNEIWATCTVAVVHDGESTLSVELSIKDITVNVNVETEPWEVLDPTTEYQVNVQVKKGGVAQDLSKYTLSNRSNTDVSNSKDTFGFITIDAYTKAVILPIANGMPFSYLPKWVEFTAVNKSHTNRKASDKLYIKSSQRGWTGPMGNDGASYYPQGEWDANTEYVATKNSDGVVIARPIVYHDPLKNGNGTYYVLEADKSIDDDPAEFSPSVWRAFQSFEYLFTKVLMAQWAQLADAVFRGSYMFSSYGVDANGDRSIYSNFQDSENNMFDSVVINGKSTYRLNGKFTPNIFLDLLNGGAKFNCLSEPFVQMNPSTSLYKIDPSIAHNVSVQYERGDNPAMIFMPESDSLTDGVNCTVVYQSISMIGEVHEMDGVKWGKNLGNKLVILCADGRMRNTSYETDRNEGFFMVNGIPTRMLFIAPGDVVKLKSVEIVNKKRVWVVENQSDFSIMKSNFYFKKNKKDVDDLFNVVCNNLGWYSQGMDSSFASASIMAKAPNEPTPLNYNVYLEDGSLEAYND